MSATSTRCVTYHKTLNLRLAVSDFDPPSVMIQQQSIGDDGSEIWEALPTVVMSEEDSSKLRTMGEYCVRTW